MAIVLQGHADRFDIDNYLLQHDYVYWRAPRLSDEMKIGTDVFIWRAGQQAGVIAHGKVAERPCEMEAVQRPEDLGEDLWKNERDAPSTIKVGIAIDDFRLSPDEGMLLRSDLEKNDGFMNATIIMAPQGTVFKLSEKEYECLYQLWQEARLVGRERNVLAGITRDAIIDAINECDNLGRDTFLKQYGFKEARSYFLSYDGRLYDSKAIIGVAHKYIADGNEPLTPNDFSGGDVRVASRLRSMGFDVPKGVLDRRRNPFLGNYNSWVCSQEGGLTRGPRGVEKRLARIFGKNVQDILAPGDDNDKRYPAFVGVRWGYAEVVGDTLVPTDKWDNRSKYNEYGQPEKRYKDFGDAPNDDPRELQQFAARVRRGQPVFRENLMKAYGGRCVISGHGPAEVLEAVHIVPHAKSGINALDNGLLMRADLHSLFDAGLITIHPKTFAIVVDEILKDTPYCAFNRKVIRPREDGNQPTPKYLKMRWADRQEYE